MSDKIERIIQQEHKRGFSRNLNHSQKLIKKKSDTQKVHTSTNEIYDYSAIQDESILVFGLS